jgi:homoserine O-acetyltransferase
VIRHARRRQNRSKFRRLAVAAALASVALGCHRAPPLLTPSAAFWQQRAPERFDVRVETTRGPFVLAITRAWSPIGVDHFYNLVRAGYYDDSRFSRVVPGFIAQFGIAGNPRVTAAWKDRTIADDPVVAHNERGTIAFAMTGPNTRTTQLYISLRDNTRLDAQGFSPLGRVISGMDVVDSLYDGYGENSGGGVRAGKQGPVIAGGNAYLDEHYPRLDHLIRATVLPAGRTTSPNRR